MSALCHTASGPADDQNVLLACSLRNNALTNYGQDMSGIIQITEALKVNMTLQSIEYATDSNLSTIITWIKL